MKIVHAADLHIDSPLRGLDRYDGAPVERLRGATRRALENLVALCTTEKADLLLLAGDIFDGQWKDYSTGLFFSAQMTKLREAGVPVVIVKGNHDAASTVVKALRLPDNVHELSAKKPETLELRNVGIAVHGQSFSQKVTTEDLAARYPERVPGLFNIGLLHTSLDGREGHDTYAPTNVSTMRSKGYDYWALGHVHAREIVSTDPYIVYPGNIQGRHARESGIKGASVITVDESNVIVGAVHYPLDVLRWEMVTVDVGEANDAIEAIDLVRAALEGRASELDGRALAARVLIAGRSRANTAIRHDAERFINELRAMATDLGESVWVEKVIVRTAATIDLERLREEASAVGHLARRLSSIRSDEREIASLIAALSELDKKLPQEAREGDGAVRLDDASAIRAMLDDVEQMLLPRLIEGEGS